MKNNYDRMDHNRNLKISTALKKRSRMNQLNHRRSLSLKNRWEGILRGLGRDVENDIMCDQAGTYDADHQHFQT